MTLEQEHKRTTALDACSDALHYIKLISNRLEQASKAIKNAEEKINGSSSPEEVNAIMRGIECNPQLGNSLGGLVAGIDSESEKLSASAARLEVICDNWQWAEDKDLI